MLMGFPRYWFSKMYQNIFQDLKDSGLSIFQDALRFKKMIFRTALRLQDSSTNIQTVSNMFSNESRFNKIYFDFKIIHKYARLSRLYQDASMLFFLFLFKTIIKANCSWPTKISYSILLPHHPCQHVHGIRVPTFWGL